MDEIRLTGGNITEVVRVGDTVRRPRQPWSDATKALLSCLASAGYEQAPIALGTDEKGRQVLSFIDGRMGGYPIDPWLLTTDGLLAVIASIARFHAATTSLIDRPLEWQQTVPTDLPREVICHVDLAPYNLVLNDQGITGWIDFDTACPGPAVWDWAYAAYTFTPMSPVMEGVPVSLDRNARFTRFAEAAQASHDELVDWVDRRLVRMIEYIVDGAASGDHATTKLLRDGHADFYRAERVALEQWLGRGSDQRR